MARSGISNFFAGFTNSIPSFMKNKYILTGLVFTLWMLFFDKNSVVSQYSLSETHTDLMEKIDHYEKEESRAMIERRELYESAASKEKFAREKHYMKKTNEDVFIIEEGKSE